MPGSTLSIETYQHNAAQLRRNNTQEGWEDVNAQILLDESIEAIFQHAGASDAFVSAVFPEQSPTTLSPQARFKAADELGDVLWALADTATRSNATLSGVATQALEKHTDSNELLQTFAAIGSAAILHAPEITIPTKTSLTGMTKGVPQTISLENNAFAVYGRTTLRVVKGLSPELASSPQPTAIDFEPAQDLAVSLGELLLTIGYIGEAILDVPLGTLAEWNIAKLQHRNKCGKQNDLAPTAYFAERIQSLKKFD